MKLKRLYILLVLPMLLGACELNDVDNYDAPDAKFYGQIIDEDTGEPIPQDLINGSVIEYVEQGFENPQIQQLRFKTDGSFRNDLMFSGEYEVRAVRGNFYNTDTVMLNIKGDFEYTFKSRPYIRIKDVDIYWFLGNDGNNYIVASYKLDVVASENVKSVFLFADKNPNVGYGIRSATHQQDINRTVDPDETLYSWIPVSQLNEGEEMYFRVGALIDRGEAKPNLSMPIKFKVAAP